LLFGGAAETAPPPPPPEPPLFAIALVASALAGGAVLVGGGPTEEPTGSTKTQDSPAPEIQEGAVTVDNAPGEAAPMFDADFAETMIAAELVGKSPQEAIDFLSGEAPRNAGVPASVVLEALKVIVAAKEAP